MQLRRAGSVAALGATMILGACTPRPAPDATGEDIFALLCVRCHGPDLAGGIGPPLGPGSNAAEQPDEFLILTIAEGKGRMPSFGDTLTDEQVGRVVEYLRGRQAG